MTLIALETGATMVHRRFATRDAAVMTSATATGQDLTVVHDNAAPVTGVMTGAANRAGQGVIQWLVIAVTIGAQTNDLIVIHAQDWTPRRHVVTGLANIGASDMVAGLADTAGERVATHAALTIQVIVVDARTTPGRRIMAITTRIAGLEMRCRLAFGAHIIVTGRAAANHFVMIHVQDRTPGQGIVAGFALHAAIDMCAIFRHCVAAIMTAHAGLSGDSAMIELGQPGIGAVTIVAGGKRRDMVQGFTASQLTIVTILAQSDHGLMIDKGHRFPSGIVMTSITLLAGVNMRAGLALRFIAIMTTDTGLPHDCRMIDLHLPRLGLVTNRALR